MRRILWPTRVRLLDASGTASLNQLIGSVWSSRSHDISRVSPMPRTKSSKKAVSLDTESGNRTGRMVCFHHWLYMKCFILLRSIKSHLQYKFCLHHQTPLEGWVTIQRYKFEDFKLTLFKRSCPPASGYSRRNVYGKQGWFSTCSILPTFPPTGVCCGIKCLRFCVNTTSEKVFWV